MLAPEVLPERAPFTKTLTALRPPVRPNPLIPALSQLPWLLSLRLLLRRSMASQIVQEVGLGELDLHRGGAKVIDLAQVGIARIRLPPVLVGLLFVHMSAIS